MKHISILFPSVRTDAAPRFDTWHPLHKKSDLNHLTLYSSCKRHGTEEGLWAVVSSQFLWICFVHVGEGAGENCLLDMPDVSSGASHFASGLTTKRGREEVHWIIMQSSLSPHDWLLVFLKCLSFYKWIIRERTIFPTSWNWKVLHRKQIFYAIDLNSCMEKKLPAPCLPRLP